MEIFESKYNLIRSRLNPRVPPLKKTPKKAGFFSYIFKQRGEIKRWNNTSQLIHFSSFGLHLTLNSDFKQHIDNLFIKHFLKLQTYITELLKNGWRMKFLTVWDYNVIVNFKKFYDRFYQVVKQEELIKEDFFRLERAYVKITYRSNYIDVINKVFEKYLKTENKRYEDTPEKFDELLINLRLFFESYSAPHSLREIILAYNMCFYRTYCKWGELFPPLGYDIVQNTGYNCSREVFNNLIDYYNDVKKTIESLKAENIELLRLRNNCNIDKKVTPPILIRYYESLDHSWKNDKSNYYIVFILMTRGVIEDLDNLIFRSWSLLKENEVEVHQRLISDHELPELFRKLKRIHDVAYSFLNADTTSGISIEEFRVNDNPELLIKSEQQKKMYGSFKEILSVIFEISQIMFAYGEVAVKSDYITNGYFKYMLNAPEEWIGKPVFALFNYYIELFWTICAFFKHKTFWNLEGRLAEINKVLHDLMEEKKRIDSYGLIDNTISDDTSTQENSVE